MPVTQTLVKATSSFLSLKRNKHCLDLSNVAEEVKETTSSILSREALETVDFYDRDDFKVGKALESGHFFEWCKVRRMPYHEVSETSSATGLGDSDYRNETKKQQYTVKQLNPKNFAASQQTLVQQAALRLVLEAKYLARLDHPSIVQVKALPFGEETALYGPSNADSFFLVVPRMVETLEVRLVRWRHLQGDRKTEIESLELTSVTFQRKLKHAKDLASALAYLHERNLVLLNLSPKTIGFLESGALQITDLSCCHEDSAVHLDACRISSMDESELAKLALAHRTRTTDVTTNYLLQIATDGGVPRHIAPEVILHDQYTTKADVYSWSLILFELLTLSQPYITYKTGQHLTKVCVEGQRPNLSVYRLPNQLQKLLCRAWCQSVSKRPTMSKVLSAIPSPQLSRAKTVASPQA